jgi:hypothetical protein
VEKNCQEIHLQISEFVNVLAITFLLANAPSRWTALINDTRGHKIAAGV